jgi:excisionase family DNA binding protein
MEADEMNRTLFIELLSVRRCAEILGVKESTVRAWLLRRRLPRVNCGRAVRIPADAIAEFIERNTVRAREPR